MQQEGAVVAQADLPIAQEKQVLIVLCGLIGSGKSSFAEALQKYYPNYIRCNQDSLGSRKQVISLASRSLHAANNAVIDRTNVDEAQRAHWIDLAHSFDDVEIHAIVFDTPLEVCKARLAIRTDHETIQDPQHALSVLQQFYRDFITPKYTEGFHKIVSVTPNDFSSATPTKAEIDMILQRMQNATRHDVPIVRSANMSSQHRRGNYRGGGGWQARGSYAPRGGYTNNRGADQSDWRARSYPRENSDPTHPQAPQRNTPNNQHYRYPQTSTYQYNSANRDTI